MKLVKLFFLPLLLMTFLSGCSESEPVLTEGDTAIVTETTYLAIDEDAQEQVLDMATENNNNGIMAMIANGDVAVAVEGTEVTVTEAVAGYNLTEVMVADGSTWLVPTSVLEQ